MNMALENRGEFRPLRHSIFLRRLIRKTKSLHRLQKRQTPLFENNSTALVRLIAGSCDQMFDIQPADFGKKLTLLIRRGDCSSIAPVLDSRLLADRSENINIQKNKARQNDENKN